MLLEFPVVESHTECVDVKCVIIIEKQIFGFPFFFFKFLVVARAHDSCSTPEERLF